MSHLSLITVAYNQSPLCLVALSFLLSSCLTDSWCSLCCSWFSGLIFLLASYVSCASHVSCFLPLVYLLDPHVCSFQCLLFFLDWGPCVFFPFVSFHFRGSSGYHRSYVKLKKNVSLFLLQKLKKYSIAGHLIHICVILCILRLICYTILYTY